jgi:putative transposase
MVCADLQLAGHRSGAGAWYNREFMVQVLIAVLSALLVFFRSHSDIALEILALRQQVAVLKRQRPRPPLNSGDRLFWTSLRRFWPRWSDVLLIVKPETVIG